VAWQKIIHSSAWPISSIKSSTFSIPTDKRIKVSLIQASRNSLLSFKNKSLFLKKKKMESLLNRITIDPEICHGKPTIRGLRYPVENMLELLASGMTIEELIIDYPDLEKEDFLACLEYAAKLTNIKSIHKIAS